MWGVLGNIVIKVQAKKPEREATRECEAVVQSKLLVESKGLYIYHWRAKILVTCLFTSLLNVTLFIVM
jgi:hypothetical protein